jgi:hypothetical protein
MSVWGPVIRAVESCFETDCWTWNIYRYTASWKRSIANNVYANSSKGHTVNMKRNIQTLRQTPVTQRTAIFINLELIWTVMTAWSVHVSAEIIFTLLTRIFVYGKYPLENKEYCTYCNAGKTETYVPWFYTQKIDGRFLFQIEAHTRLPQRLPCPFKTERTS